MVLALVALGTSAAAEERLGEVVVTAPAVREETAVRDPTASATVIDTRAAPATVTTLSEALSEAPGVQVRRFGGLGDFATASIRGSSAGQVQVYLDGVPLSRADTEVVNLADLPLDVVERVEVYRGTTPLAFTQAGAGGVVNIVTRRPGATPTTAASASYGSFTTRKVDVLASGRRGPWEALAFGHYLGSAGDFTFTDDLGFDQPVSVQQRRQNNAFDQGDVVARLGYHPEGPLGATLTSETFAKEQGVPGLVGAQALDTSLGRVRQVAHVEGTWTPPPAALPVQATTGAYVVYQHQRFSDPEGEIAQFPQVVAQNTIASGGQVLARGALGAHHVPGLLLGVGSERLGEEDLLAPGLAIPDKTQLRGTVAGEDEILLWGERLSLLPGVRWELVHDDFAGDPREVPVLRASGTTTQDFVSPRFGVRLTPVAPVTLLANVGRYARFPNLQELYGDAGVVVGNPDLQPEVARNVDTGVRWTPPAWGPLTRVALEYTYFDNQIDDLIVLTLAGRVLRPVNVGRATVQGSEFGVRGWLWERVGLMANYTHQDATDDTVTSPLALGDQLPGRPANEMYARAELTWSPAEPLPFGALAARWWPGRVFFDADLIADNVLDVANAVRVGQRTLLGAGIDVTLPFRDLRVGIAVKNLTDDQTRDVLGFPLPGRSVFATVSIGFGAPGHIPP